MQFCSFSGLKSSSSVSLHMLNASDRLKPSTSTHRIICICLVFFGINVSQYCLFRCDRGTSVG